MTPTDRPSGGGWHGTAVANQLSAGHGSTTAAPSNAAGSAEKVDGPGTARRHAQRTAARRESSRCPAATVQGRTLASTRAGRRDGRPRKPGAWHMPAEKNQSAAFLFFRLVVAQQWSHLVETRKEGTMTGTASRTRRSFLFTRTRIYVYTAATEADAHVAYIDDAWMLPVSRDGPPPRRVTHVGALRFNTRRLGAPVTTVSNRNKRRIVGR